MQTAIRKPTKPSPEILSKKSTASVRANLLTTKEMDQIEQDFANPELWKQAQAKDRRTKRTK